MNMTIQIPFWVPAFSYFGHISKDGTAGSYSLAFWRVTKMFPITAVPFYIPTTNAREFQFLHILTSTCYFCLFLYLLIYLLTCLFVYNSHPHGCEAVSHYGFDLHFPTGQWRWTSMSLCVYGPFVCIHSLEKYLFKSFANFSSRLFCCWVVGFLNIHILDMNPSSGIWSANIFAPFVGCLFILLTVFLDAQSFKILIKSKLSVYFSCLCF